MALIEWSDDISVGIKLIDEQHKRLVSLINALHEANETGNTKGVVKSAVRELDEYVRVHFITEEEVLRVYGYPDYEQHKRSHTQFADEVRSFYKDLPDDDAKVMNVVMTMLKNWLTSHILKADKAFGPYLKEQGMR